MPREPVDPALPRPDVNQERFEVRITSDSHFGWIRTRLSVERTMMSWLRTATALIGFGFAIVQFFERLEQTPGHHSPYLPTAPVVLGLALILSGVLALVISIWQYLWIDHYLRSGSFAAIAGMTEKQKHSPVLALAVLLICIGIFAFFAVLLRLA
ncbi:MAG: YidH family protein [Acetobacteraceae bacterium]